MDDFEARGDLADGMVRAALARGARRYAVVDAAQSGVMDGLGAAARARAVCLYDGPEATVLSDIAPYLVPLDTADASLPASLAAIRENDGGFVATSAWPLPDLRRHLRRFLRARSPADGVVLFRFYDPRVLGAFYDASTDEERARLLAPFDEVMVPVDGARWRVLPPTPRASRDALPPRATRPFELREAHLEAFAGVAFACFRRRASSLLREVHAARLRDVDDATLNAWFDQELPRAHAYGLRVERDVVGWFLLRIGYGEALERERPWLLDVMCDEALGGADKLERVRRGLHLERQRARRGG